MKKIAAMMLMAVYVTGCASMNDQDKTRAQGAGAGAVLGALLGAGAGAVIGHQTGDQETGVIVGALVGAGVGTLGGLAVGDHVAKKKAQFAKQEDYLDACIAEAQKVNNQAVAYNTQLKGEIDQLDQQADQLLAQVEQKQARKKDLAALSKTVNEKITGANATMAQLDQEIAAQKEVLKNEQSSGAGERLAKLQTSIEQLEQQKAALSDQTQRLASINNRMAV